MGAKKERTKNLGSLSKRGMNLETAALRSNRKEKVNPNVEVRYYLG